MKKTMKHAISAVLTTSVVATAVLGTVASAATKETDDRPLCVQAGVWEEEFERANPNLNGLTDDINDETLTLYKTTEAEHKGTILPIEYDTYYYALDAQNGDALSHENPLRKQAFVYLPYGYDESIQYNVLYLYHGGGDDEYLWFKQKDSLNYYDEDNSEIGKGYAVNILDHMFEDGLAEPCIVVTPALYATHYFDRHEADGTDIEIENGIEIRSDYQLDSLRYELWDLVAAVESTYSTYAEATDTESLIASRDHRAMAGLSMGSLHTWHSGLAGCISLFSWFAPMSAGPSSDTDEACEYMAEVVIPAIDEAAEQGYDIKMLLNLDGVKDVATPPHATAHQLLVEYAENSDNLNVGENYDFLVSNGRHMFRAWNLYLYDMLQVFFR